MSFVLGMIVGGIVLLVALALCSANREDENE